MFLFVKIIQEEETLDLGEYLDRSSVGEEDGRQPPLPVLSLVDLADILTRNAALVSYDGGPALIDKKR
jgi:hypothetical protein